MLVRNIRNDYRILQNQIRILKETPEFNFFDSKQQKLFRFSLCTNMRSLRQKINQWQKFSMVSKDDPYFFSSSIINHWFCHAAVQAIIQKDFSEELLFSTPDSFFEAKYSDKPIKTNEEVQKLLKNTRFPCVIHLAEKENGKLAPIHSFIVIGTHPKYGQIVWDKEGCFLEFRVIDTKTMLGYYPSQYWGVRPI